MRSLCHHNEEIFFQTLFWKLHFFWHKECYTPDVDIIIIFLYLKSSNDVDNFNVFQFLKQVVFWFSSDYVKCYWFLYLIIVKFHIWNIGFDPLRSQKCFHWKKVFFIWPYICHFLNLSEKYYIIGKLTFWNFSWCEKFFVFWREFELSFWTKIVYFFSISKNIISQTRI